MKKKPPTRIIGFFTFWFGFASAGTLLYTQYYMGMYSPLFTYLAFVAVLMLINGLYMMSGTKFSLSLDFWRGKFGAGYPLTFGSVLSFWLDIIIITSACIVAVFFFAPLLVQKLFALLVGNTIICLFLYFRYKNRRKIE